MRAMWLSLKNCLHKTLNLIEPREHHRSFFLRSPSAHEYPDINPSLKLDRERIDAQATELQHVLMAISKNKADRPSKVVKPKQSNRKSTTTFKNHRYESFNDRILRLKIDPVRRKRDHEGREGLTDERATYFGRSLARWRDLNLSHTFVSFAAKVSPLSDSLPLLLHNQEQVITLLVEHIEKRDALAMEPLLNLMSDFAHDLDSRFESHFQLAVRTISEVAAKHPDPAVVEWSFNCLAWLFKYLSRLLTPDLRPVYDLMAPYLGKEPQKPYIVRFAAESMSFLIRKAAVTFERDSTALETIVEHIFADLENNKHNPGIDLYQQGVLVLLTDAIKGVQQSMHSAGPAILRTITKFARLQHTSLAASVVHGVLTSLIHFSSAETFAPALSIVIEDCRNALTHLTDEDALFSAHLLLVVISVRKGSRIGSWPDLLDILSQLTEVGQSASTWSPDTHKLLASAVGVTVLYCSDPVQLARSSITDTIVKGCWRDDFLKVCDFVARMNHSRFTRHFDDKFRVFAASTGHSEAEIIQLLTLLPSICGSTSMQKVETSHEIQAWMVKNLQALVESPISQCASILPLAHISLQALPYVLCSDKDRARIKELLGRLLKSAQIDPTATTLRHLHFIFGVVLEHWLLLDSDKEFLAPIFEHICTASHDLFTLSSFWANVARVIKVLDDEVLRRPCMEQLQQAMLQALCLPDHSVRSNVLDAVQASYQARSDEPPAAVSTAVLIESTPLSLENGRSISMNIRRLAVDYSAIVDDAFLLQAIPRYCLGLLHLRFSQAWDDSIETLSSICKISTGEDAMMEVIQQWLFTPPSIEDEDTEVKLINADEPNFQVASDFECPNLARISALSAQLFEQPLGGRLEPDSALRHHLKPVAVISDTARSQALRVLNKLPQVAEKRSRLIVPTLLQWARPQSEDEATSLARWNRKDQKAMLNAFSQFHNPKVLYKSAEVHEALLNLCTNGDVEIQKAALKALLAWKTPEIIRYEDHLVNLLDDSRYREELSVFLQGGEEDGLRAADLPSVMPVLLRLLYGRLVGGSKEGQQAKRKAVFVALSTFPQQTMAMFIDISLSTTRDIRFVNGGTLREASVSELIMPLRQQLGMLNMLGDMVETLGPALQPFGPTLLNTLLGCTVIAHRRLQEQGDEPQDTSLLRSVRQTGLQGLYKLFSLVDVGNSTSECRIVARELLQTRLDNFVAENAQSISATLRIISSWSKSDTYASFLTEDGNALLTSVADLISSATAKLDVKIFVLTQIFDELLKREAAAAMPASIVAHLAHCLAVILQGQPDSPLLTACVRTLQSLAGQLHDESTAHSILTACRLLLVQPSQIVASRTKVGLLRSIQPLLTNNTSLADADLYNAVSGLFSRLHDLDARAVLSEAFSQLATTGEKASISAICVQLNSLDAKRLNEPDYEAREHGFMQIYAQADSWNRAQWTPVLHNCLHFLRDETDTVNRASAAKALQALISNSTSSDVLLPLVQNDLFSAIQRGMAQKSEFVRAEYLGLLHSIVLKLSQWKEVSDMRDLAFDGDDEASFFTNVLHIQQHRRLRALRRLAEASKINSKNIVRIFLPLLEQFIFDQAEGDAGRTLADQAIQTIGQLARRLRWSDIRKTLLRYYGFLKTKDDLEKTVLRLIGAAIDGLSFAMTRPTQQQSLADGQPNEDMEVDAEPALPQNRVAVVLKDYLPPLQTFLHQKDESKVDRRVGIAISIVKLARLLPEDEFTSRLAPTLTDVSHILKSRDIEAREQTRRTLSTILGLVGPQYLRFMLKELRGALLRGYQLHVLSYTVHHLLVTNGVDFNPGDVDECIPELTGVVLDDIFGVTGQEKDAEEYKSGMKEVKSSKSYDTMELLARMSSVTSLGQLVLPIRSLLQEKLDARIVKKIDDLLVRVRRGIDQNPAADTRDMLIFCHELVRQVYAQRASDGRDAGLEDWKLKKYLNQSRAGGAVKGATTSYIFKLSAFALALLRKVLRRHEELSTPANLAGFLPMIGDGLVAGELDVKIESAKLLSTILRVELPAIDAGIHLYLKEAIAMVKGSHSTMNDAARAGLELATAILRERRETTIREKDVAILLRALKADIDEPDRQGQTFRFLRAVLGRKIVIPEIYEVMDDVARIMVNNPDESVRQNARAAYVQFVVDFPQGKERWARTTAFLVKNLGFEHVGGRKSVLEVVHTLLGRLSASTSQEILLGLFVGLVPRVVGDSDASCRNMASMLIRKVLEKADAEQESKIKALASKWLQNDKKDGIRQAAVVCWTILLQIEKAKKKDIDLLLEALSSMLDPESDTSVKLYTAAAELLIALCEINPARAFASETKPIWTWLTTAIASTDSTQQELVIRLHGLLYNDVASTTARAGSGLKSTKLVSSAGLNLNAEFWCKSCNVHLGCLRNASTGQQDLITATSKNLVFLGRVFAANEVEWTMAPVDKDGSNDSNDDEQDPIEDAELKRETSALGYLMSRLAYIVRRENLSTSIRTTALQTAAALMQILDQTIPNLGLLTRPVYVLTDPTIPQPSTDEHKMLVDKAREVLDIIQKKIGSQQYVELLGQARKAVGERRDERRRKRRIEAVSQPERWAKEKRRRSEVKKARSKAKTDLHRSQRRGW